MRIGALQLLIEIHILRNYTICNSVRAAKNCPVITHVMGSSLSSLLKRGVVVNIFSMHVCMYHSIVFVGVNLISHAV